MTSTITRPIRSWNLLGQYELEKDATEITINIPTWAKEILIYYGHPNSNAQVYGGGSVVLTPTRNYESHPCLLTYTASENGNMDGLVYLYISTNYVLSAKAKLHNARLSIFLR